MKVDKKDNIIIERIDSYNDKRFSQKILSEHGAFIVNDNDFYSSRKFVTIASTLRKKTII